jgi:hypothetical protein
MMLPSPSPVLPPESWKASESPALTLTAFAVDDTFEPLGTVREIPVAVGVPVAPDALYSFTVTVVPAEVDGWKTYTVSTVQPTGITTESEK